MIVLAFMRVDDEYVYLEKIEHKHRDWKYNLSCRFEKEAYDKALETLL